MAAFIGSPQINLIEGRITVENNSIFFRSDGFLLELKGEEGLKKYKDLEVTIGIRPESLIPGDGPIHGEIELVEHIGSEAFVYIRAHSIKTRIAAKAPPDFHGEPGEKISLKPNITALHFFYEGKRINFQK